MRRPFGPVRRISLVPLLFLLCSFFVSRLHAQTSPPTALPVQETVIGVKSLASSPSDEEDTLGVSRQRIAWRDKRDGKWVVVVDGESLGLAYDRVEWIIFSRDNQHVAYRAQRAKKWIAVVDGKEVGAEFDEVGNPIFSPDGLHLAYPAKQAKSWMMVVDGQSGPPYRELGPPRYSPDSARVSYNAKQGNKWLNVLDGKESALYDDVTNPTFTPDSKHVYFVAAQKKQWFMTLDQQDQEPAMASAGALLGFTPDAGEPIYLLGLGPGKGWAVSLPNHQGPPMEIISRPVFEPISGRFAYAGAIVERRPMRGQRAYGLVVIDGKPGPSFEGQNLGGGLSGFLNAAAGVQQFIVTGIRPHLTARWHGVSSPILSPDGQHVAYAIRRDDKDFVVLLDGEAGPTFEDIACAPAFAPDGRLAYAGIQNGQLVLIIDGSRVSEYSWNANEKDLDGCTDVLFTDDGRHSVFVTIQGGMFFEAGNTARAKRRVFVDGQPGKEYDATAVSNFRSRGARLAYEVHNDKNAAGEASFVVIANQEGPRYDVIVQNTLSFTDDNAVTYLARRDRTFVRVTHALP
jgi:hypothetical protein